MPAHTAHFCFAQASQTDCVRSRGSACAAGTSTGRRGRCGRGVGSSQRSERCARRAASYCGNTSPPQFFPSPAAARGKLVSSTPCVSSPPAKRGRGVNPPHSIGAPRVLIEPTRTFRSAGNGDGSCRSWHRRHNVDSIVQRVFPLWLAASLRIPGGAGTSTPVWTSKSTASSTHDTSPAFVHLSADSQPLSARIARPPYGHLGGSSNFS
ncbi:hypothetical protein DIPPA_08490 [Diplonema papillatum]|nr:hypothetical protein DIPPA_08490 [Diplonema papillatum]